MQLKTLLALLFVVTLYPADPVTVYLKPPVLTAETLSMPATCDRPRRKEGVKIAVEEKADKLIVHCYGHGGFGITTLFGSIQEAIELLLSKNSDTKTSVHIVGSGCMGLCLAVELHRQGFTNITISTKEKYAIPSWRAGGFFDPGTGDEISPEDKHHTQLGLASYHVYNAIANGWHPYLSKDVVRQLPIYYPADIQVGVEILEKLALMPPSELVTLDFGNNVKYENYKRQETYFIDVTKLMSQLWDYIKQENIPVIEQEVPSLETCKESIVCNCTGLGARHLNNDDAVYPARGHFYMLKDRQEDQKPADYMLFTKVMQDGKKEIVYLFPKQTFVGPSGNTALCVGMLGGTFINDPVDSAQEDQVQFAKLADRAQHFFYGGQKSKA